MRFATSPDSLRLERLTLVCLGAADALGPRVFFWLTWLCTTTGALGRRQRSAVAGRATITLLSPPARPVASPSRSTIFHPCNFSNWLKQLLQDARKLQCLPPVPTFIVALLTRGEKNRKPGQRGRIRVSPFGPATGIGLQGLDLGRCLRRQNGRYRGNRRNSRFHGKNREFRHHPRKEPWRLARHHASRPLEPPPRLEHAGD
jgi:hypothetical protein